MLYTGHGDAGYTHVIGSPPLLKCDTRVETIGTLDEALAQIGVVRALLAGTSWPTALQRIQHDLSQLMAEIATLSPPTQTPRYIADAHVQRLESDLAAWETITGGAFSFVTPGDTLPGAHAHLARTMIRRAERQAVALFAQDGCVSPIALTYLNRLSSWLYGLTLMLERPVTADAAA